MRYLRTIGLAVVGLISLFSVLPAFAQITPKITLAPRWSATSVLTSLDNETNFVSVDLMATTNMEFWAVDITCTVPTTALELYPIDSNTSTLNTTDDVDPFQPSSAWGVVNNDYQRVPLTYTANSGVMRIALSRLGQIGGIGLNGQETTFSLGRLTYRIKTQAVSTFIGTVALTCTSAFVNRNGQAVVAAPLFVAPPLLEVRAGYTITGVVMQQSLLPAAGVAVSCDYTWPNANNTGTPVRTTATGAFTLSGLRAFGIYRCQYYSNLLGIEAALSTPTKQAEPFLAGESFVPLVSSSYTLQPVILRGGNASRVAGSEGDVDTADISAVTGAGFGSVTLLPTAYATGDANGDKKIDKADLALVTSNYGVGEYVSQDHYLLAGQLYPGVVYPDSRIYVSTTPNNWNNQEWRQAIPGINRDFWPAISPDGSKIAFVRSIGTGAAQRFALFVMPSNGVGVAVQLTPAITNYDAFAPSWSPDGTRIAFVTTFIFGTNHNYQYGNGNLAVIDASGKNLRFNMAASYIYPPTWQNNDKVVFGGTYSHKIQYVDLNTGVGDFFDPNMQFAGGYWDMPNIINGRLYYRFDGDGDYTTVDAELRMATLYRSGSPSLYLPTFSNSASPSVGVDYHVNVPLSGPLAYYSVAGLNRNEIVITQTTPLFSGTYSDGAWSTQFFDGSIDLDAGLPQWATGTSLYLTAAGNPYWDGNLNSPTDMHALRATIVAMP